MSRNDSGVPGNATIRDVANRANVALSSVSRVLSGHPDVSAKMRAKVELAAAELEYQPDHLAQSLRQGRTTTIGFLLRDISNPLFADVAKRCEHDLRLAGYSMIIMSSDGDADVEATNLSVLRRRRVDGVIASLVSETAPATVAALKSLHMPLVLVDREVTGVVGGAVLTDHYEGVRAAVDALLRVGHTRVAFVTGTPDVRSSRQRTRAIRDAYNAAGVSVDEELLVFGTFDEEWGHRAARTLLELPDPPTAILAGGVGPTMGTLRALRDLELIPNEQVEVVALDEWPHSDVLSPRMSSVDRRPASMGAAIAAEMLSLLNDGEPNIRLLPTAFEPRGALRLGRMPTR